MIVPVDRVMITHEKISDGVGMIRVICTYLLLLFVGTPAFADNDFDTRGIQA